jgi:regulatory protein
MRITAIEKNEKAASMATVFIDSNITFCLPIKRIELLELKEGKDISEVTLNYILQTEVYAAAKSAAVSFLAMKLRTAYEVVQKLSGMGYEDGTIEKVIDNLKEINYIDDLNYTRRYISEKSKLKPKSKKLLSIELSQRGIPDDIISTALEELELDEGEVALELLRKKYSRYSEFDEKLILKMKAFLMGRGFSYSQISKAVSSFVPDE